MSHHPAPWWYRLAERLAPDRCREIPEATDPTRVVLRQVALIKRYLYVQQFASGENPEWMHSHQWLRTFALGLWGGYRERRHNISRWVSAPYAYTMGVDVIHQVIDPTPGHTSLFLGLFRNDDLKQYFRTHQGTPWEDHIQVKVKRI